MIESNDFRNAMSLLTTAVNIVTTKGDQGIKGFTASAVSSVTDTPPTLLLCMNQASRSHDDFVANKILCVNVLGAQQQHLSTAFAAHQLSCQDRFKLASWTSLLTGSPVLVDALVSFDCEIEQIHAVGTHSIFICRVLAIQISQSDRSLAYFNRAYHQVGQLANV